MGSVRTGSLEEKSGLRRRPERVGEMDLAEGGCPSHRPCTTQGRRHGRSASGSAVLQTGRRSWHCTHPAADVVLAIGRCAAEDGLLSLAMATSSTDRQPCQLSRPGYKSSSIVPQCKASCVALEAAEGEPGS